MRRREFITLIGGTAAGWPLAARAQQAERVRRIGVLAHVAESDPVYQGWVASFRDALAKLGWIEGRNLRIDYRWAGDDAGKLPAYAAELVALAPDALFAIQSGPVAFLQQAIAPFPSCSRRSAIRLLLASSAAWRGRRQHHRLRTC